MKYKLTFATVVLGILVLVLLTGCGNISPVASFTCTPSSGQSPLTVSFNASASHDPDGTIVTYQWTFGDGSTGTDATTSHTYTATSNRTYTVTLTVTDDGGSQATDTHVVSVAPPPLNSPPVASFTRTPSSGDAPLNVSFDASGSYDSDGSITSYTWDFGDGGSSLGVTAAHTYNSTGTYTVQLTVTDDDGATDTTTIQVKVSASSVPEDLYVDANSGSDTDGDGTQRNPYKTITKAVGVANAGGETCTIHVAAGIYSAALGEAFPLVLDGVNLLSEAVSADQVKIVGELTARSGFIRGLSLYRQLTIDNGGVIELDSCRLLNMDPGNAIIISGSYDGVSIHDCYLEGNQWAIQVGGGGPVTISNNHFVDNYCAIYAYVSGAVTISSNTIEKAKNGGYGIKADSTSSPTTIVVRDTVISADRNELYAPYAGSQFQMEGCTVSGYRPLYIIGSSAFAVDLGGGSQGSRGGNTFIAVDRCIYDQRPSFSGPLYAKNNTWNDPQPTGTVEGPVDNPPNYYIENEGNSIIFSE